MFTCLFALPDAMRVHGRAPGPNSTVITSNLPRHHGYYEHRRHRHGNHYHHIATATTTITGKERCSAPA